MDGPEVSQEREDVMQLEPGLSYVLVWDASICLYRVLVRTDACFRHSFREVLET